MSTSSEDKKDNPGRYRTVKTCETRHRKLDLALFGEDGRGGIVKDIAEIKAATSVLKTVFLPIILSITASVITFLILGA